MRTKHHIIQGILISIILILTTTQIANHYFSKNNFELFFVIILAPYFILLGSIYPDTDEPKSNIFKVKLDNRKIGWQRTYKEYNERRKIRYIKNFFLLFFQLFKILIAYPLRWLVYYPSLYTIKKIVPEKYKNEVRDEHHCTTHTFLGIGIASCVLFIVGNVIFWLLTKSKYTIEMFQLSLLLTLSISLGFIIGTLIHFVQDAYSGNGNRNNGITPFYPFKDLRFYGDYSSWDNLNAKDRTMSFFIFIILLIIPWSTGYIFEHTASILTGIILMIIWNISLLIIVFSAYGLEFKMRIERGGETKYLSNFFKKNIIGVILLNIALYLTFIDLKW